MNKINPENFWRGYNHQPQPRDGRTKIALANEQPHRSSALSSQANVEVITLPGGGENQSLGLLKIAWNKILHAKASLPTDSQINFFVGQDTKTNNWPKPEDLAEVRENLRSILNNGLLTGDYSYRVDTATAIMNGHANGYISSIRFMVNASRLQELLKNSILFDSYAQACSEYGPGIFKVSGGFCFEALWALGLIEKIDQSIVANLSEHELSQAIRYSLHNVLAPVPDFSSDAGSHLRPGSEYGDQLHLNARILQKTQTSYR